MLLYIHIPFCDSKCAYCSFNSYVDKFHLREKYMQALEVQLAHELRRFKATPGSIETLFIGGGTPSSVAAELYQPLFKTLKPYLKEHAEITSEANPNSATAQWLEGMRDIGVNRISFGVQSFDDKKLHFLARAHKSSDAVQAIETASRLGFKHISLDLIYATYMDSKKLLEEDLKRAFSLPIDHLSAYALTIEEGTPFSATPEVAKEKLEMTEWFLEKIRSHGLAQYEISNFGTYRSQHNLGYWQYKAYIGLGSGAVGFLGDTRYYPTSDIDAYIADPLQIDEERLDDEDIKTEKLFLGLRSIVGFDPTILDSKEQDRARLLLKEKKLSFDGKRYYNPDYLLSDELALFITT